MKTYYQQVLQTLPSLPFPEVISSIHDLPNYLDEMKSRGVDQSPFLGEDRVNMMMTVPNILDDQTIPWLWKQNNNLVQLGVAEYDLSYPLRATIILDFLRERNCTVLSLVHERHLLLALIRSLLSYTRIAAMRAYTDLLYAVRYIPRDRRKFIVCRLARVKAVIDSDYWWAAIPALDYALTEINTVVNNMS